MTVSSDNFLHDGSDISEIFSSFFEQNPCSMLIFSYPEGDLLQVNETFLAKSRLIRKNLTNSKNLDLKSLLNARDFDQIAGKIQKSQELKNYPLEIIADNGFRFHFLIFAKRILLKQREILLVTALDITAEKDLQFRLTESESRYRAIFENSMMGVVILDRSLIIRDLNPVFASIADFEIESLRNNKLTDFIHPVETELVEKLFLQKLTEADGMMTTQELQLTGKDGSIKTVVSYVSNYYDDRLRQEVLIVMFDDISEKKKIAEELIKSEQKHRMIADYVLDVIWISDLNLRYSFISPSIYKFQGFGQEEFLNLPLDQTLTQESLIEARRKLAESYSLILSGEAKASDLKATMEMTYKHKNGHVLSGEVTAVFITDSKGNPTGILGVTRDITERKKNEKALHRAKAKAEEANRLKSLFLANVSHEIRTPVSGIIGFTSRLIKHIPDESYKKQLRSVRNSAELLLKIINDLLDVSRIEAGKLELEKIDFNFRRMLSGVTDLFTHTIQEKKLYFHYAIDEAIPQVINGDPTRIGQILINILGNAFKFTSSGGIEFTVLKIRVKNSRKLRIKFTVKDTGEGIADDKLNSIFNAFTQADISHTRKYGGTGLGLTIASRLIEKMNGTIKVESSPKEGTVFEYDILVGTVKKETDINIDSETDDIQVADGELSGMRILIAEDNDLNREYLKMLLEDYGVEVIACCNGQEAVDCYKNNSAFNGIILDIQMPELDGYATARQINSLNMLKHRPPIIGLSASGFPEEEKMAIDSGMDSFMIKPAREDKLLTWLKSLKNNNPVKINVNNTGKIVTAEINNNTFFDTDELLQKNSQRLSSLLPLVELMLDTGRAYIADIDQCIKEKRNIDLKQLLHKFRGRVSIFNCSRLFNLLNELEQKHDQTTENLLLLLDDVKKVYSLFENKLFELRQIIKDRL